MRYMERVLAVAALAFGLAAPAAAQQSPATVPDHSVTVFAGAGGFNGLTNLDDASTADFKKLGYSLRAGGIVQLQRYVALRGNFTFARNQLRLNGVDAGTKLNRFFYDAAVQLQYPTTAGIMPYVFVGGGAVTLHEVGTSGQNKTKGAGTAGVGISYTVPGTGFGVFAEGQGWLWSAKSLNGTLSGYDKTQLEAAWTGGISYRFPF